MPPNTMHWQENRISVEFLSAKHSLTQVRGNTRYSHWRVMTIRHSLQLLRIPITGKDRETWIDGNDMIAKCNCSWLASWTRNEKTEISETLGKNLNRVSVLNGFFLTMYSQFEGFYIVLCRRGFYLIDYLQSALKWLKTDNGANAVKY